MLTHLYALLEMAKREGVERCLRPLLYGWARYGSARPESDYIRDIQKHMREIGVGRNSASPRIGALLRDGSR